MYLQVHAYVGLILSVIVRYGIRSLESYTIPLIYKLLSRKLLNSEEYGNASGNGNSFLHFLLQAISLYVQTRRDPPGIVLRRFTYLSLLYSRRTFMVTKHHTYSNVHLLTLCELKNSTRRVLHLHINK